MGTAFLYGNGGSGGIALNFSIVGGTAQPANPKENTIWVNTDTQITSWVFSATEPENPADGMVLICTGTSSVVKFNALKKNGIMILPLSAKQYVSGAWVDKTAMIYQGGAWKDFIDWSKWIVKEGLANPNIEAACKGAGYNGSITAASTVSFTEDSGSLKVSVTGDSGGGSMVYFGKVDLTSAKSITMEGTFQIHSDFPTYYQLVVWSEIGIYQTQYMKANKVISATGGTLDTSALTGSHYVGFMTRGRGTHYLTNLYMTKE